MDGDAEILRCSAELVGFDICGFSRFAEEWLSQSARATVDDLARVWDQGVAPQVERLNNAGYQVADLCGDAVLAYREVPLGREADRLLGEIERDFAASLPGLTVRTARALGPLARISVSALGARHHWASGPGIEAVHRALDTRRRAAHAAPDLAWMHPTAGRAAASEWVRLGAELRTMATLFLRAAPHSWMWSDPARIAALVRGVAACAADEDGHLEKITHDDKGVLFRCSFAAGAIEPIAAAIRAGRAALRLLPPEAGAGIAEGQTYCGPVRAGSRTWLTSHGPAVNRAAKAAATATTLVAVAMDAATGDCLRELGLAPAGDGVWIDRQDTQAHPSLPSPIPSRRRDTFVGRAAWIAELSGILTRPGAADAPVLITGPAGQGKSAVVEQVVAKLCGAFTIAIARARPTDGPRGPWPTLLDNLVRQKGPLGRERLHRALLDNGVAAADLSLLTHLGLASHAPGGDPLVEPPAMLRDRLDRLFDAVLKAVGDRSLLVIEDVHWLMPEARRWLERCMLKGNLRLLLTSREQSGLLPGAIRARQFALPALDESEVQALLAELRPDLTPHNAIRERIWNLSHGSPLLARQLAFAWPAPRSRDDAAFDQQLAPASADAAGTLDRVLDIRLDGLRPREVDLMRRIAIESEGCALGNLAAGDREEDGQAIARLIDKDLVSIDGRDHVNASHALIAEAVLRRTPGLVLRLLHVAAARRLGRAGAPQRALIGTHWREAASSGRAAHWLARAAREAEETGAHRSAIQLYESALECCPPSASGQRLPQDWRSRLAASAFAAGDLARGRHEAQACKAGSRLTASRRRALVLQSEIATFTAEPRTAVKCLWELRGMAGGNAEGLRGRSAALWGYALALFRLRPLAALVLRRGAKAGPRDAFFVATASGLIHVCFGEWACAERLLTQALELAPGDIMPHEHGVASTLLALSHYLGDRPDDSAALFDALARAGREHDNPLHEAWGLYGSAQAHLALESYAAASARLARAEALLEGSIDRQSHLICSGLRILLADRGNDIDAILVAMDRNRSLADSMPVSNFGSFEGYAARATVANRRLLSADCRDEAVPALEEHLRSSLGLLARYARLFPVGRPRLHICRAEALLRRGRRGAARLSARRGLALARRLEMPSEIARAQACLVKWER